MGLVTLAIKYKFLIPKDTWDFDKRSNWPKQWLGIVKIPLKKEKKKENWPLYFLVSLYSFGIFINIIQN